MPPTCTICRHEKRKEIDRAIVDGESLRDIAGRYGTSDSTLHRHKPHVMAVIAKAHDAMEITHGDNLVAELRKLIGDAQRIAGKAEQARQFNAAMSGVREVARVLELIAKLTGALDESTRIAVMVGERQAREKESATDLRRLSIDERISLQRLLEKARSEDGMRSTDDIVDVSAVETVTEP